MSQSADTHPTLQTALDDYRGWKGDPVAILKPAVAEDTGFWLGHTTLAVLCSLDGVARTPYQLAVDRQIKIRPVKYAVLVHPRRNWRLMAGGDLNPASLARPCPHATPAGPLLIAARVKTQ
jgi:hypothetical protein